MRSAECGISVKGRSSSDPSIDTPHSAFHTPHYLAPILTLRTMEWLTSPETWIALLTLTVLEIVLGIDNIIFISILAGKLPAGEQPRARTMGLTLAMVTRILLLLSLTGIMRLTLPLFSPFVHPHPTLKMLALSFLLLIGVTLIADGLGQHIPKGYVYFAMGFSVFVESLNLRLLRKAPPVHLKESITP